MEDSIEHSNAGKPVRRRVWIIRTGDRVVTVTSHVKTRAHRRVDRYWKRTAVSIPVTIFIYWHTLTLIEVAYASLVATVAISSIAL